MQEVVEDTTQKLLTVEEVSFTLTHLVDVMHMLQEMQNPGQYWGGQAIGRTAGTACPALFDLALFPNPHACASYRLLFIVADKLNETIRGLLATMQEDKDRTATLGAVTQAGWCRTAVEIPNGPLQVEENPPLQPTP